MMTQRIVLSGDNAAAYADQVKEGFGPTLADGMKRIATEMANRAGSVGHRIDNNVNPDSI